MKKMKLVFFVLLLLVNACKKLEKCSDAKGVEECESNELKEKCISEDGWFGSNRKGERASVEGGCNERPSKEAEKADFDEASKFCSSEFLKQYKQGQLENYGTNCANVHVPVELAVRYRCKENKSFPSSNLQSGISTDDEISKVCIAVREKRFKEKMGL